MFGSGLSFFSPIKNYRNALPLVPESSSPAPVSRGEPSVLCPHSTFHEKQKTPDVPSRHSFCTAHKSPGHSWRNRLPADLVVNPHIGIFVFHKFKNYALSLSALLPYTLTHSEKIPVRTRKRIFPVSHIWYYSGFHVPEV